jgi:DNA-binding GntR family transcriptional regulator
MNGHGIDGEAPLVERKTLHERAYEALVRLIASGALPAGAQLDEQATAARLGISRTPTRAAIARLIQDGLVMNLPYRGAFVRSFTADEIDGLYHARAALEALAARSAAERMTAEELAHISALLTECQDALDRGDLAAFGRADVRFHQALAAAAGNATVVELLGSLRLRVQILGDLTNNEAGFRGRAPGEAMRLREALERRDGEAAARLIEAHIDAVRKTVLRQLVEREAHAAD